MSQVHSQARTTPRTRAEIEASPAPLVELEERYNISRATAAKWKRRETPHDLSHRPHKLNTTLTPGEEANSGTRLGSLTVACRCVRHTQRPVPS